MFSFFTKKDFLVDYLEGFVDIHNHILPGIDDGAKNVEESIELIKAFGEFGVRDFICTPHIMSNYYENTPKTISTAYNKLQKSIEKENIDISISYAAEHMIDDNFENILDNNQVMPLGENHLLVEMSYLQPSINFEVAVKKVQEKQFFPVLAHPERYIYLHQDFSKYEYFKSLGIKFQLNALSVFGYYGKNIQKTVLKLLKEDFYDFIATDVHNTRQLKALKAGKVTKTQSYALNMLIIRTIDKFMI